MPTTALPRGTTGGSEASTVRDVVVSTRDELVAALAFPDATPKIVRIAGTLDATGAEPDSVYDSLAGTVPS